ncbi:MAG: LysM peptidoglycan-binding domain-containing M23 family metallopeptidase [bacterium]
MQQEQTSRLRQAVLAGALAALLAFAPQLRAEGGPVWHTVRRGETLSAIARRYGSTVSALAAINGLDNPNLIYVGQRLSIPGEVRVTAGVLHRVEHGDTLWGISQAYGVSLAALREANPGLDPKRLAVGETVLVPGVARANVSRQASATSFVWPTRGQISSHYGWRNGRMHYGLDIAAPVGTAVVAAAPGRVVSTAWNGGYGHTVTLEHPGNVQTIYAHCSKYLVKPGAEVKRGQAIARVGNTGNSTGPHLHFEVRIAGRPQNPIRFLP